ncbi:ABC transporter ATP-binding protein [Actinospongicola halichondriae]|uniref:ABC transporter ATP-binding protein n=1 Tax=Actinospongicola halichondriae TaxID=3236844 RepID=UPI003D436BD6
MAAVIVAGVSKSFGATSVLRNVSLDVDDGTTLSLLGPSGSGKSTLLRIIAGLESPDAGAVTIDGVDVTSLPTHERGVGVVFQDQALFPHLDVGGNIAFGLRMSGVGRSARPERVAEVLSVVGLPSYEGRDPATLSGGEAQRVALARALAPWPSVVLLDEPLAALDQLLRERLLLELRSIFDSLGVTVVAVTHDPTEAGALGQKVAVLLDGRIAQIADPGEVLTHPVSAAVAGLVGHRNVADGVVRDGSVVCAWGRFPTSQANGPVSVLVRPDGIAPSPDGDVDGVVTGRIFRGGSAFAVVAGNDSPPLDVRAEPEWKVGDHVRLAIDPSAVHLMTR